MNYYKSLAVLVVVLVGLSIITAFGAPAAETPGNRFQFIEFYSPF